MSDQTTLRDAIADGLAQADKSYEIEDVIDAIEEEILIVFTLEERRDNG